ncbi:outer membrane beta-barrel protein [Imperialibacter roseus]|uniref:Outer membrane beta-barrel protein n=1 Tax=Imperialibacter roseus TaxID=1324217 RepID=A0ABZ0IN72_9BACT|nr:outer membrane beta-barrel protein [Imperialibacter roseus]WOK05780.1 outer membrane beta-barrel protein [Imperialibacter roseus]
MRSFVSRLRRLRSTHLIFLLCGLWVHDASAQDDGLSAFSPLRYGAKVGANLNQFSQTGMVIDVNGGAVVSYQVSDLIGIRGELLYMGIGGGLSDRVIDLSAFEGNILSVTYENRSRSIKNVELPVMAAISIPTNGSSVSPKFLIGASYGYSIASFESRDLNFTMADGSLAPPVSNTVENVSSSTQSHQFAMHGGFALEYGLGNGSSFYQEIRYRYGLDNINIDRGRPGLGGELIPSTISLNFGYFF